MVPAPKRFSFLCRGISVAEVRTILLGRFVAKPQRQGGTNPARKKPSSSAKLRPSNSYFSFSTSRKPSHHISRARSMVSAPAYSNAPRAASACLSFYSRGHHGSFDPAVGRTHKRTFLLPSASQKFCSRTFRRMFRRLRRQGAHRQQDQRQALGQRRVLEN